MQHSAVLNVMIKAAHRAARSLKRDLGELEHLQVSLKGPRNFVTAADHRAEAIVREELAKARPDYGFLGEEGGTQPGTDKTHRWIVDPLDGTTNFLHGIPHFAIAIALERNGTVDAIVACGLPHYGRGDLALARNEIAAAQRAFAGLRRYGAATLDLAWIAAGRLDAYWERDLSPWDLAAGSLLVREAGGFVSDIDGGDAILQKGSVVAGNETMHRELLRLLRDAGKTAGQEAAAAPTAP